MTARNASSRANATFPAWTTQLVVGGHHLVADEPRDLGGGDNGPAPDELVLAALAACTSITVRMYAERKKWPLQGIDVDVGFGERERGSTKIVRTVTLTGPLDAEQRTRLHQIAEACPVHKLLTGSIEIATTLAG